ncbi:unnamed protein product [Protopolystoma xenopodis]|uniref:Uncharacterized protein n=1 Tax=Protopolystoma xenopodis TaxID=117903 RepID=A0A448WPG6_9PLAT|nr:unnamed protein product [Protopolystoma xenopodis]
MKHNLPPLHSRGPLVKVDARRAGALYRPGCLEIVPSPKKRLLSMRQRVLLSRKSLAAEPGPKENKCYFSASDSQGPIS